MVGIGLVTFHKYVFYRNRGEIMNFGSKKTQRTIAIVIVAVLILAMVIPAVVSAF